MGAYDVNIQMVKYCGVFTWNIHTNGVKGVYAWGMSM